MAVKNDFNAAADSSFEVAGKKGAGGKKGAVVMAARQKVCNPRTSSTLTPDLHRQR